MYFNIMYGVYKWSAKKLQKEMNKRYPMRALSLPQRPKEISNV